jgi:integrase
MLLDLPYVQHRNAGKQKPGQVTGHFRYRRKVPLPLIDAMGKRQIVKPLGRTWKEALRRYDRVHAEAEAELKAAATGAPFKAQPSTPRELHQWALQHIGSVDRDSDDMGMPSDADVLADYLHQKEPEGPRKAALIRALMVPDAKPSPTFRDAVKLYPKDRVEGTADENKKRQRVERVRGHVEKALGRDPVLISITRPDARAVRDHMQADSDGGPSGRNMAPATVHRYLNDIRAIINHAVKEFDGLAGVPNHFNKLEVKRAVGQVAKDDRKPFTPKQLEATRTRILGHASVDLQRIWRMLEGTGCRLAEVTGLTVEDVHADHDTPYLNLVFHPHRRLKNTGSVRRVPLIGDALAAAKEALQAARDNALLFPAYGRKKGPSVATDAVSQALMKHVRKIVPDPKVVVHSLRHTMEDRLIEAEVPKDQRDLILGHSRGKQGETYGGPEARLKVAAKALRKALRG